MTAMLILNGVLMAAIVAVILGVLVWGIVTDKARVLTLARRSRRVRVQGRAAARQHVGRAQYGRRPGLSAQ
jgi:hypothetical protein